MFFLKKKKWRTLFCKAYGVNIYPAKEDLAGLKQLAEENPEIYPDYRYMLRDAIKEIRNSHDFLFVDLPPSHASQYMVNALTAADSVLIPMQCEFFGHGWRFHHA